MACPTCKKVKISEPTRSGLQYSLVSGVTSVEGRNGKKYPIGKSLFPPPHTPRGGWRVTLHLHGQATEITGSSASVVFIEAKNFLQLNGVDFTDINLWYNLNIQWLERAVTKYRLVLSESLLALGTANY